MLGLLFGVIGCGDTKATDSGSDPRDTATAPDTAAPSGCPDGWAVGEPDGALYVSLEGDDAADGEAGAPVATLARALSLARARGTDQTILLGEGSFAVDVSLEPDGVDGSDEGLTLAGCPGATTLTPDDPDDPMLLISEVAVVLLDLQLEGGRPAVWAWNGAQVDLERLAITDSERLGFLGDGGDTLLRGGPLTITDTLPEETDLGDVGYGLQVSGATVEIDALSVAGSTGVGALFDDAEVILTDVDIRDTVSTSLGTLGRGIQLQSGTSATITGGVLEGNADAGVFALLAPSLVVSGVEVSGTVAATLDGGETSGDGIVVTQGGAGFDPALFVTTIEDNVLSGNVFEHDGRAFVAAELSGNTVAGNGYEVDGTSIVAQGSATVAGSDAAATLTTPLPLDDAPLATETP